MLMALKEAFHYLHFSREGDTHYAGLLGKVPGLRQEAEARGKPETFFRFSWERQGMVNCLGLANLNKFYRLWDTEAVPSCLVAGPGLI